jgi:energy-coupling factor transporter ATP-binding protein EcfA2
MTPSEVILAVSHLRVSYDSIQAVDDISFDVGKGEIVTLIGANGAGKSSILRAISGLIPYSGSITYSGKDLKNIAADQIVAAGIAHVPEGRGIFGNLTVLENLKIATWQRKDKEKIAKDFENVFSLFPRLRERRKQGRHALRRRTADAGRGPRAHDRRADASAGRTIDGTFAGFGARYFQDHSRHQSGGKNNSACRTKRQHVVAHRATRLRSGNRPHRAFRHRQRTDGNPRVKEVSANNFQNNFHLFFGKKGRAVFAVRRARWLLPCQQPSCRNRKAGEASVSVSTC